MKTPWTTKALTLYLLDDGEGWQEGETLGKDMGWSA